MDYHNKNPAYPVNRKKLAECEINGPLY